MLIIAFFFLVMEYGSTCIIAFLEKFEKLNNFLCFRALFHIAGLLKEHNAKVG